MDTEPSHEAVEAGARALVHGPLQASQPIGDVLYDYDWTPREAAEAVLASAVPIIRADQTRRIVEWLREKGLLIEWCTPDAIANGIIAEFTPAPTSNKTEAK